MIHINILTGAFICRGRVIDNSCCGYVLISNYSNLRTKLYPPYQSYIIYVREGVLSLRVVSFLARVWRRPGLYYHPSEGGGRFFHKVGAELFLPWGGGSSGENSDGG